MNDPGSIRIDDFNYDLPAEKIAQYPLAARDASRLLVCRDGTISDHQFAEIAGLLPHKAHLVFNDTRVIHARLLFRKVTGGQVEIFCLEPLPPATDIQAAFLQRGQTTWKCLVGNLKRWRTGTLGMVADHEGRTLQLYADFIGDAGDGCFEIAFRWSPAELSFAEVLETCGKIPLPPYIDRTAGALDTERYQTIFARNDGSVAAPTAGLHFSQPVMEQLRSQAMDISRITLHVGIGTFRPVTADRIGNHIMHNEKIVVPRSFISHLADHAGQPLFAVGTTSARTIESLYWLGVKVIHEGIERHPAVGQWDPYSSDPAESVTPAESLNALLAYLDHHRLPSFSGETRLMILPGYRYRLLNGLITNFHMPQSTLLLLVAALVGDAWKKAYDHALAGNFRFLSYGDSCLFFNPRR